MTDTTDTADTEAPASDLTVTVRADTAQFEASLEACITAVEELEAALQRLGSTQIDIEIDDIEATRRITTTASNP